MLKRMAEELRIGMSCLLLGLCVLWLWLTGGLEDLDDWPEGPADDGKETAWEQRP